MVTPQDFIHRLKSQNYVQNIEHHVKVLLKRFRLNGYTIAFRPQTQKLEPHTKQIQHHVKVLLKRFHLNGHSIGFRPQTQKFKQYHVKVLRFHLSGHTARFHPLTQKLARTYQFLIRSYIIFLETDSKKYLRIGVSFGRQSSLQNQQLNLFKKGFLFLSQFYFKAISISSCPNLNSKNHYV